MKYSIVIPTYNHCNDLLKPCVEAIFRYSNLSDIELVISANGCTDNTFEYLGSLKEKFKSLQLHDNLKVVWNKEPLGYGKATNEGIKISTSEYIVLLNNDAFLLEQEKNLWLNALESSFHNFNNCAVSCVLKKYSEITKRDFAVFFCVMIKRNIFEKIGLISEEFQTGGSEDIDFCYRAEQLGYIIDQPIKMIWSEDAMLHVGSFPIYHKGEATMHDTNLVKNWDKIFKDNELVLAKKYNPEWYNNHNKLI